VQPGASKRTRRPVATAPAGAVRCSADWAFENFGWFPGVLSAVSTVGGSVLLVFAALPQDTKAHVGLIRGGCVFAPFGACLAVVIDRYRRVSANTSILGEDGGEADQPTRRSSARSPTQARSRTVCWTSKRSAEGVCIRRLWSPRRRLRIACPRG